MKHVHAIALVLLFALSACGQRPPDYTACNSAENPDQRIAACTQAVASGQLSKFDLANALHARGKAWAGKGDLSRARADYSDALRANPIYLPAIFDRFMAELNKSENENAGAARKASPRKDAARKDPIQRDATQKDAAKKDAGKKADVPPAGELKDAAEYVRRGAAWGQKREFDRAIADYNEALRIDPKNALAYFNRGLALQNKGDYARAIADYLEVARLEPKNANPYNSAAWLLATAPVATARNGARAVEVARKAAELSQWKDGDILDTLAAAHAEAGNFPEAVRWQQKAMEFPEFMKNQADAAVVRLAMYRERKPYHQPGR